MKKKVIASTFAALTLAATLAVPTFAMGDGSVHFSRQYQPLSTTDLNPQPLPPGRHGLTFAMASGQASGKRQFAEPPDPCLV